MHVIGEKPISRLFTFARPKNIISSLIAKELHIVAHPGGRPTGYTFELAKEICQVIASGSKGIKRLCNEKDHWPTHETVYQWLNLHKEFSDLYRKAKAAQVEVIVDEVLEISDDSTQDSKLNNNGDEVCNSEYVNRSRLRVDSRKWLAARLAPKLYGDNAVARELSEEIEELKRLLKEKGASHAQNNAP